MLLLQTQNDGRQKNEKIDDEKDTQTEM